MIPGLGPSPHHANLTGPKVVAEPRDPAVTDDFQSLYGQLLRALDEAIQSQGKFSDATGGVAPDPIAGSQYAGKDETRGLTDPGGEGSTSAVESAEMFNAHGVLGRHRDEPTFGHRLSVAMAAARPTQIPTPIAGPIASAGIASNDPGMSMPSEDASTEMPSAPDASTEARSSSGSQKAASPMHAAPPRQAAAGMVAAKTIAEMPDALGDEEIEPLAQQFVQTEAEGAQESTLAVTVAAGENGLEIGIRLSRHEQEARSRLREEIGAMLARHGLRLADLRMPGDSQAHFPGRKEMDQRAD
jgi:hypothetical protein